MGAANTGAPFAIVLGVAQDGGYPQAGCYKECCQAAWDDPVLRRRVACLGLVDPSARGRWLIDATPDFRDQLAGLDRAAEAHGCSVPSGILLTHGHYGHISGLLQLGKEVMSARQVAVYAMPGLARFLRSSPPWRDLVDDEHIALRALHEGRTVRLSASLQATPVAVPHRAEHSETVAYRVQGPRRTVLYVPDIDDWDSWPVPLEREVLASSVSYVDGTFFDAGELPSRRMTEVRHPTVAATMEHLAHLPPHARGRVRFLHFNHTNPLLRPRTEPQERVRSSGFAVAEEGERVEL